MMAKSQKTKLKTMRAGLVDLSELFTETLFYVRSIAEETSPVNVNQKILDELPIAEGDFDEE